MFGSLLLCVMTTTAQAESSKPAAPNLKSWLSPELTEHLLVGLVWSEQSQKFITPRTLALELQEFPLVLLGERHDNADHHRLQAWVIDQLTSFGPRVVGFEMLSENVANTLKPFNNAEDFAESVDWAKSGWPEFSIYAPVFEAAIKAKSQLLAIHPSRERLMKLMRSPETDSSEKKKGLGTLSDEGLKTLQATIKESHCGHANEKMVSAMVKAQRFKDHWMSQQMLEQSKGRPGILVAGNGHVRKDYGLPNHLSGSFKSVGFVEVSPKAKQAADYEVSHYDYVWFTPRWDSVDPCIKYKDQLEKIKAHYKKKRSQKKSSKP